MDAISTSSRSTATLVDQCDYLFQLGYVDSICIFCAGCNVRNLAGNFCCRSTITY